MNCSGSIPYEDGLWALSAGCAGLCDSEIPGWNFICIVARFAGRWGLVTVGCEDLLSVGMWWNRFAFARFCLLHYVFAHASSLKDDC